MLNFIDIGNLNSTQNYSGFVDNSSPFDLYKFSLSRSGSFNFSLNGLSNNADVQLLNSNGSVLYSSTAISTNSEAINIDDLAAGDYAVRVFQVSGQTSYNLSLNVGTARDTAQPYIDSITGLNLVSGYFTVGQVGEVGIDFVHDGGSYQGELAIFNLEGMDKFSPGSVEFIKEATRRSLSNSQMGYVVISDPIEGAKFSGGMGEKDYNDGSYLDVKTFAMKPGDNFGFMLVSNGTVQQVFNNPAIGGDKRPLFSLVTANPLEAFHVGQIADINGSGTAFVMEDLRVDTGSDKDYNDIIFKVTGATGKAVQLDDVINPAKDWRDSTLGRDLIDYVKAEELTIEQQPPIDTAPEPPIDTTPIEPQPPIDTAPEPPTDTTPIEPQLPVDTTPEPPIDTTPIEPQPPVNPPYPAINTLGTARNLGTLSVNASEVSYALGIRDFVGNLNQYDYYRFNFEQTNNFNLRLDELSADAKVELIQDLNNNNLVDEGEVLETSTGGTAAQLINRTPLENGIYYVRVSPGEAGADTPYSLCLTVTPSQSPNEPNQALIGIIDTGFSGNNPDIDYRQVMLGRDRIDNDNNPLLSPGEGNQHGTHILGLIAAIQGNGIGIDGINNKAQIWLGRAVGSGGWADSLIEFVDAARASQQRNAVVNLSLDLTQVNPDGSITTRYEFTPQERQAIEYARQHGVLLVVAAGNDGGVMSVLGQASQEFDNIITVGASDEFDRANYSSYGAGLDILTDGGTTDNPVLSTVGNGVGKMAGTSVTAAKATGVASLVWAANPDLSYRQVIDILKSTATDLKTPGWDAETGSGLLNQSAAVELAKNTTTQAYTPEPWVTPFTWDGEGKVTPIERAAQGGNSIATATQVPFFFSDNDKVDSIQPEKYYQFTVDQSGYVRWTVTRTDGSAQFPNVTLVKADGTLGRFKFSPFGGSVGISVGNPTSKTDGVFVDPGTYYVKVSGGWNNSVQNYNLSNNFIPDLVSGFSWPANFSTAPYFDFTKDNQRAALDGPPGVQLNVSGEVDYNYFDHSQQIAKYGLEVREPGKLNLNLLSPNGMAELTVKKFIGFDDQTVKLISYEVNPNSNEPLELNLNQGRYQIEVTTPFAVWQEPDWNSSSQTLSRPYTLTGVFSRLSPTPGEGKVPVTAGDFLKTVTSNGVDTHYYKNGYLSIQPKGYSTWYTYGTGQVTVTATPIDSGASGNVTIIATPIPVEITKKYSFKYYYGNGSPFLGTNDSYTGYVYAKDGAYSKGQIINETIPNSTGNKGYYIIGDVVTAGGSSDVGKVYITSYYDGDTSKERTQPEYNKLGSPSSFHGLGSERDYIGTQFFSKTVEIDGSDPDGNGSISTAKVIPNKSRGSVDLGEPPKPWSYTSQGTAIGGNDLNDYYVFDLQEVNSIELQLTGLNAKAGFELIKDTNNNGKVDVGEVVVSAVSQDGIAATPSRIRLLEPGTYYVRVFPGQTGTLTNYNLHLAATPTDVDGNGSLPTAQGFGGGVEIGDKWRTSANGSVGGADLRDYYVFDLNQEKDIELKFYGSNTSAKFNLIQDKNNNGYVEPGEVLASGTQTQPINYNLKPGTYYAEVYTGWMGANTNYGLSLVQDAPYKTAINQEYQNFSGLLGNPTGDYWQAGTSQKGTTGYGRNYEHGTIHWTPQYGAVALWYDFQDAYSQNGGSSGWLGFPTKDKYDWEGGQRIDFEGGYIFWTPGESARTLHYGELPWQKSIDAEYESVKGLLGNPTGDYGQAGTSEKGTTGYWRSYEHGTIHWTPQYSSVALWYGLQDTYNQNGGSSGWLGFPTEDNKDWEGGQRIDFEGGYMFWTPAEDARTFHDWELPWVKSIEAEYADVNSKPNGSSGFIPNLGNATTEIMPAATSPDGTTGYWQAYDNDEYSSTIHWSPKYGAVALWKGFQDKYGSEGGSSGWLGFPKEGVYDWSYGGTVGRRVDCEGGYLYWQPGWSNVKAYHYNELPEVTPISPPPSSGGGVSGNYYPALTSLTSDQWDEYSGDNTRFDGIRFAPYDAEDERYKTPPSIAQIYTDLSSAIFGNRHPMNTGYAFDPGYAAGYGSYHDGIDIQAVSGVDDVKAAVSGKIEKVYPEWVNGQWNGWTVVIDETNAQGESVGRRWHYVHLKEPVVKSGTVNAGEVLAKADFGHLHLSVYTQYGKYGNGSSPADVQERTMSPLQAFWEAKNKESASTSDGGNPNGGNSGGGSGAIGEITNITVTPIPTDPNGTLANATNMGTLNGSFIRSGDIGYTYDYGKDEKDYYRFEVDKDNSRINLSLERLSGQIWDAGLELRDENGSLIHSSIYAIGRTLNKGTYYVGVSSISSAKTDYTLRLVELAGETPPLPIAGGVITMLKSFPINIWNYGNNGSINQGIAPNKNTVLLIHGRTFNNPQNDGGRPDGLPGNDLDELAKTLAEKTPDSQVIALDWREASRDEGQPPRTAAGRIIPVAQKAVNMITSLGIDLSKTTIVGHSLGSYIAAEIGQIFQKNTGQKVKNLVALDPALPGENHSLPLVPKDFTGAYDINVNDPSMNYVPRFDSVASKSIAFVVSDSHQLDAIAGDNDIAATANNSLLIQFEDNIAKSLQDKIAEYHSAVNWVFKDIIDNSRLGGDWREFELPSHLDNQYANDGSFGNLHEGVIEAIKAAGGGINESPSQWHVKNLTTVVSKNWLGWPEKKQFWNT